MALLSRRPRRPVSRVRLCSFLNGGKDIIRDIIQAKVLQLLDAFGSRGFHLDVYPGDAQTFSGIVPYLRGARE